FLLFLVRCTAILFIGSATSTRQNRILLGTEMWAKSRDYVETTLLLWSILLYCFLKFSLSTNTLDYKFLSVFAMPCLNEEHLVTPSTFGLGQSEYRALNRFRGMCTKAYYSTVYTIPVFAPFAFGLLFARDSLFATHLISSLIWLCLVCF